MSYLEILIHHTGVTQYWHLMELKGQNRSFKDGEEALKPTTRKQGDRRFELILFKTL